MNRRQHWDHIYQTRDPASVSWHQPRAVVSLERIQSACPDRGSRILDVGGGASTLVDHLLDAGYEAVGVLDVSPTALDLARARLGPRARRVEWFAADVTRFVSPRPWDLWHDRAVLHFLLEEPDRAAYRAALHSALAPGGHVVVATFGPEGPTRCSGLDVQRCGVRQLGRILGPGFELVSSELETHVTPAGADQQFLYASFRRV
jgi:SAM-dependent methyltransferase